MVAILLPLQWMSSTIHHHGFTLKSTILIMRDGKCHAGKPSGENQK